MESLRHSLTLLVTLSISLSTSIAHPRHGGRTHKHKHAPRQGAFAGIQMLSSPEGQNPTDLLPSDAIAPASVSTAAFIPAPTTDLSENSIGLSISNTMTRTFPITVLQIPVATICPPNASIPLPTPCVAPSINITTSVNGTKGGGPILNTTSSSTNATHYLPPTAKVSIHSPTVSLADHNARVILGDNGCQTLFSPTTTAICSTVVSVGGQVPVSVTDCGQRVTFSSSPICGPVATAAPNGTGGETMAYFLAPWYDIAAGAVPTEVEVRMCSSAGLGASSSCVTGSESWSVSTTVALSTALQTARFFGGAIGASPTSSLYSSQIQRASHLKHPTAPLPPPLNLTLIPHHFTTSIPSTNGSTTTLSIDTTLTHTSPYTRPTIVRSSLTSIAENTITITVQLPPTTRTYNLEEVTGTHGTTTVTLTVEQTRTSKVIVATAAI